MARMLCLLLYLAACSSPQKRANNPNNRNAYDETDEFYRKQQQLIESGAEPTDPAPYPGPPPYQDPNQPQDTYSDQPNSTDQTSQPDEPAPVASPSPPPMEGYPQGTVPGANDIPTAKPAKNGLVESPYVPGKNVDVEGYPPGATVKDPYIHKLFIVPAPLPQP